MQVLEFELRAIRPPVPYVRVLARAGLLTLWVMFWIRDLGDFPVVATMSVVVGLAAVVILARQYGRPQPAGSLRLSNDRLESTAHAPAIALSCSDVRDIQERGDAIVVRCWVHGPFVIHARRLDVPLSELRSALDAWYKPDPVQRAKNARIPKMMVLRGLAVGLIVGLLMVALPILFR